MKSPTVTPPSRLSLLSVSVVCAGFVMAIGTATAGSIFITGHDPVWHSGFGSNAVGAKNLAETAIDYARNGSAQKFLFIENTTGPVPGGNAFENPFLASSLKYAGQYDVMNASDLTGLANFRTTLNQYSAIVVASDHGGMLTAAELSFLNGHSGDIIDYINNGGGLAAFAESNATGNLGATPRFQFLPFLVASTDFQSSEIANTVTAFGGSLGLANSDVNGNFSHNFFSTTGGMTPVDLYNGDQSMPLSLAFRGSVGVNGVPEPSATIGLLSMALLVMGSGRRFIKD